MSADSSLSWPAVIQQAPGRLVSKAIPVCAAQMLNHDANGNEIGRRSSNRNLDGSGWRPCLLRWHPRPCARHRERCACEHGDWRLETATALPASRPRPPTPHGWAGCRASLAMKATLLERQTTALFLPSVLGLRTNTPKQVCAYGSETPAMVSSCYTVEATVAKRCAWCHRVRPTSK